MWKFLPILAVLLGVLWSCKAGDAPPEVTSSIGEVDPAPPETPAEDSLGAPSIEGGTFDLQGKLVIDGSSTVFPITEAATREFVALAPGVKVHLGVSGTGGGFKKFCRGETDISDASRPIKAKEDRLCRDEGVDYVEIPIAFDGISVVVHRENSWARCMTIDELRRLWQPSAEGSVRTWREIRDSWPAEPVHLYGPGRESGTYDYFTHAVVGQEGQSRNDFTGSEDDYLIAQDIAHDPQALGFFGFAYYREYQDRLRAVAIDPGAGCVAPSPDSINSGRYRPLSRPIFLYVSTASLKRKEVERFLEFYLTHAHRLVEGARYIPLPERAYTLAAERLRKRLTGSLFDGGSQIGLSIEALLDVETGDSRSSL